MQRLFFLMLLFFIGCRNESSEEKGTYLIDWEKSEKIKNEYAEGFRIEKSKEYYRITVTDPQTGNPYGKYVLYPAKGEKPQLNEGETGIAYPIQSFASVSTTHLPFLKILNEQNRLSGFAGQKFVIDPDFLQLFQEGKVKELGSDNNINHESLIELQPDIFMVYPFGSLNFDKISSAGIPVFQNTDYLELHPLGKAEWIKVFGLLFDKKEESEILFQDIRERYKMAQEVFRFFTMNEYPTVFTGLSFSGTWYVPGGKSYQAQMLKDAWAIYEWQNDPNNNSLTLAEESVIDRCIETEYWVIVSAEKKHFTKKDLIQQNPKYAYFRAAQKDQIIFCNSTEKDIFGEAIIEPDVVLNDLIHFLYPGLLKDYSPKYFELLK